MPEARIVTLRDWKGHRSLRGVYSQSDVLRFERFDAQLFRVAGIVWPPAPIVQKLIKSNHTPHEHDSLLTHHLGYYCDLQSINSEDALTWNYFGPLMYAQPHERVQFAWWSCTSSTLKLSLMKSVKSISGGVYPTPKSPAPQTAPNSTFY